MEIFFKLGNCLVFDLHHEITDGHFIHLRSVFFFLPSHWSTNQINEN